MKVILALPLCLLWSCATVAAPDLARDNPLFDRYGDISFKAEKLRLNNYAIQLQNTPGSRGLIIVYSDDPWTAEEVKARARRAVIYLVKKRGISADRLKWRYEGKCRQGSVNLYLLFPSERDPGPSPDCIRP